MILANDPEYMGAKVNSWFTSVLASIYLALLVVVSLATIALMIVTKVGAWST